MNAAVALAELEELDRFLSALTAQQALGEHICCAAQPSTVNGSPETLVEVGVEAGAHASGKWAAAIVAALEGRGTEFEIRAALGRVAAELDTDAFAADAEEAILRGAMLGALDSVWERENAEDVAPARFATQGELQFTHVPFEHAVELFEKRKVLPPAAFNALKDGAKRRAFTVAGLAKQELLDATHAELVRQLRESVHQDNRGANLRDFQRFAKERLEKAGWTPANPSHVETIFRTNAVSAYSAGRVVEMRQPKVLQALPYWQILTVKDARQRPTHRAADRIVLPADHPFWRMAYPPFGYNCRCRVCARSKAYLEANGLTVGPPPQNLPDPGFESGIHTLIQVPAQLLEQPKPPPPPAPVAQPAPLQAMPLAPSPQMQLPFQTAPAPLPPPKLPAPPAELNLLAKKISDATGSNPGGIFEGSDGVRRYVKFYADSAQAAGEHLANSLYRDLGLAGPQSQIFAHEGKIAYASEILPGVKTLGSSLTAPRAKKALEGFAADVLTANWDVAGLSLDNMLVDAKGKIIRIDNGASFLTRAKGARKPTQLLTQVTEWETFFSPSKNPGYARLASKAGVSSPADLQASIKKSVAKILKVRKKAGGWRPYVEARSQGLSIGDREQIIGMLDARTAFLERKVVELAEEAAREAARPQLARQLGKLPKAALPDTRAAAVPGMSRTKYTEAVQHRLNMLTSSERAAITKYTGSTYSLIRDAHFLSPEQWYDKWSKLASVAVDDYFRFRQLAVHIDTAFQKLVNVAGPEGQVAEVYRGMRNMPKALVEQIINAPAFEWQGFTSASWATEVAERFATTGGDDQLGVVFIMKTRPETASLRMGIEPISGLKDERELLLQRGTRFRITDVKQDSSNPKRVIVYGEELLPGEAAEPIRLTA